MLIALYRHVYRLMYCLCRVKVSRQLQLLISDMCSRLNVDGLRGDLVINRAAKALVAYEGRDTVTQDDVGKVISACLNHRCADQMPRVCWRWRDSACANSLGAGSVCQGVLALLSSRTDAYEEIVLHQMLPRHRYASSCAVLGDQQPQCAQLSCIRHALCCTTLMHTACPALPL